METRPIEHSICERVWSGLDPFLRNDLDAIARANIRRHLERCVPCARDLDAIADLKRALRSALGGAGAPPGLRDEVRARLRAASADGRSSPSRNASASTKEGLPVNAILLDRELADLPSLDFGDARYDVRFAATPEEVDDALRLRFEVFNLELGEGLAASLASGRDEDEFDAFCRHLLVVERQTAEVVGTYRLQTGAAAAGGRGFYSAVEFDLSSLPEPLLARSVELGRACVARSHRNTRVLFLLWRAIAAYVAFNRARYLFGCCSLTSREPAEGARAERLLARDGHLHPSLRVRPRPGFECSATDAELALPAPKIPRLFDMYLRYGAKAASAPAIDRAFGTIDFLVLFDVDAMAPEQHRAIFGG